MARDAVRQVSTHAKAQAAGASKNARRVATTIAYLSPLLTILAFLSWSQGWFSSFDWSITKAANDVEWFLILVGPVIGLLASLIGATLAFRSGEGRAAAVFSIISNLLLALFIWSFSTSFTGVVG